MNIATLRTAASETVRIFAAILAAAALGGCAAYSNDGGFDPVADTVRASLGSDVRWNRTADEQAKTDAQVAQLLLRSVSAEDAVQIALLNNRQLQASFEELGISEAELVQSGRLPNPRFALRHASGAAQYDIEETISFNVLSLLTASYAHQIEKRRFAQVQAALTLTIARLANDTRRTFYAAVAARESVQYLQQVKSAADAGAELAQRMVAAGNWNRLDQARERSFYTDAAQSLARAQMEEVSSRERLTRLMGLSDAQPSVKLAERLAELPQNIQDLPDVERAVMQNRIDLKLERMRIDELARSLGLTRATRFINVLELGPTRVLQGARTEPYEYGYEISFEVPIFDGGGQRLRKAEARYAQAVDLFAQAAVDARSQIRQSYAAYRAAFEIARQQRDEVVPARKFIAEQNLLRYNAALISVFDLLADARAQIGSVENYVQSLRDFWMAKSELDGALLGATSP